MLSFKGKNAFLKAGERSIGLDTKSDFSFVSHAHSDHIPSLKKTTVVCSDATADLIATKGLSAERASLPNSKLLDSGHVLGGKQLYYEDDGASILYSGDIRTEKSITLGAAETLHADALIMECTYGLPQYSFPPLEQTYQEIAAWTAEQQAAGRITILGGYSLGKAQELVKILNDHAGITPVVSDEIAGICAAYEKHRIPLRYLSAAGEEGKTELSRAFVGIVPMHKVTDGLVRNLQSAYGRRVSAATASGWALYSRSQFKGFCLSDHADFNGLLSFVERVSPKKVHCVHGFAHEFAATLRSKGFDAADLGTTVEKQ